MTRAPSMSRARGCTLQQSFDGMRMRGYAYFNPGSHRGPRQVSTKIASHLPTGVVRCIGVLALAAAWRYGGTSSATRMLQVTIKAKEVDPAHPAHASHALQGPSLPGSAAVFISCEPLEPLRGADGGFSDLHATLQIPSPAMNLLIVVWRLHRQWFS